MGNWDDGTTTGRSPREFEKLVEQPGYYVRRLTTPPVGDGIADDSAPMAAALTAANASGLLVLEPKKTYLCPSGVTIPDNMIVEGNGSWIKGAVVFGNGIKVRNLKMGNTAVRHFWSSAANNILFENCWLFGGTNEGIIYMNDNSFSNIRFVACEISGNTQGGNGVDIIDRGYAARHVQDIIFERCWFHDNDRMNFECIIRQDGVIPVVSGYRNVSLYDCILDKAVTGTANEINISYDGGPLTDLSVRSSGYSTVQGCKITGGIDCLELAGPTDMLILGNELSAPSSGDILSMSQYGTSADEKHIARIIGNKFRGPGNVSLQGQGVTFVGNDVLTSGALVLHGASYSTVTGNVVEGTGAFAVSFEDAKNNILANNQIRGGTNQSVLFLYTDTTDNLVSDNFLDSLGAGLDVHDGTLQRFGNNIEIFAGVTYELSRDDAIKQLAYSASITPDASEAKVQQILATNATPFTINAPTHPVFGYELTLEVQNTTGAPLGAATFAAAYKLCSTAWVQPAAGKRRSITFYYDRWASGGAVWIEKSRLAADL